jgi:hypothetical protein
LSNDDILAQLKQMQKNEQQLPVTSDKIVEPVTKTPESLIKQDVVETVQTESKDAAEK